MEELEALIGIGMFILALVLIALTILVVVHYGGTDWVSATGKFFPKTLYIVAEVC